MEVETAGASDASTSSGGTNGSEQGATAAPVGPEGGGADLVDEFLNTGRTGRRNAVPDILDEKGATTSTAGLPDEMEKLGLSSDSAEGATGGSESIEGATGGQDP